MKTLAQLEDEAQKTGKKDFVLLLDGQLEKCSWLDPFLGLFVIDRIEDKGALMVSDFDKFKTKGINP